MSPLAAAATTVCLALSVACPSPIPDETDAGPAPSDAGVDGGQRPDALTGKALLHHRLDALEFVSPDLTPLEALAPEGAGFRTLSVETSTDGTFRVTPLPELVYLKYARAEGGPIYVVTREPELNLDTYRLGRVGVAELNMASYFLPIDVSLTGASIPPFESASLQVDSPSSGESGFISLFGNEDAGTTFPAAEYISYYSRKIDRAQGDTVRVALLQGIDAGTYSYSRITGSAVLGDVTLVEDGGTKIEAALTAPPAHTVEVTWQREEFAGLQNEVQPLGVGATAEYLAILPAAGGLPHGWVDYSGELASLVPPADRTLTHFSLQVADPFPTSWTRLVEGSIQHPSPTLLPKVENGGVTAHVRETRELPIGGAVTLALRLTPPTQLQVEGTNGYEPHTLTSLTPVISWAAPRLGVPNQYSVAIYELQVTEDSPTSQRRNLRASLVTQETSLRVPPSVLEAGKVYAVKIAAIRSDVDLGRHPLFSLGESSVAETVTGLLTTP